MKSWEVDEFWKRVELVRRRAAGKTYQQNVWRVQTERCAADLARRDRGQPA